MPLKPVSDIFKSFDSGYRSHPLVFIGGGCIVDGVELPPGVYGWTTSGRPGTLEWERSGHYEKIAELPDVDDDEDISE